MRILEIEILNNKKIRVFNKKLNGNNLEIAGDTNEGKTTAISALWDILSVKHGTITHGENKGSILVKLGDGNKTLIAKRVFTKKTSTVTIQDENLNKISIKDFHNMISDLAVNPQNIKDLKPQEKVKALLNSAQLDVDLSKLDQTIKELEEKRLNKYRELGAIKLGEKPEKFSKVDLSQIIAERSRAEENNKEINDLKSSILNSKNTIEATETMINDYRGIIEKMQNRVIYNQTGIAKFVQQLDDLDFVALEAFDEKLLESQNINEKASIYQSWQEKNKQYEDSKFIHDAIVQDIRFARDARKKALESAKWPIPDLSILDGNIIYKDCLFENLGSSKQSLVCAAIALEDIRKHEIKVVKMDGIESMGLEDFTVLQNLFNANGIQVLSTRVSNGDIKPTEIVIEEGVYSEGS